MVERHVIREDYDQDPGRFRSNVLATERYSRVGDVHRPVARGLADRGASWVLDLGGGTGTLARALRDQGLRCLVLDRAAHVVEAPPPAARADLCALPLRDDVAEAAACLWVLYHLREPRLALREAARVLRPGGWFVAATSARTNDPELAELLPGWGRQGTFDAEDAADIVGETFTEVSVETWDAPLIHLPDRHAATLFLRGRGLSSTAAHAAARHLHTPLDVTKRGAIVWGRTPCP